MTEADICKLSACDAVTAIAKGSLTSSALVSACLARIGLREEAVGAWEYLDPDKALEQARAIDKGPRRGLLHGLPVAVKDLMDTVDMPTRYGSPIYQAHRPDADAACVALARAAGGVMMGKTVIPEFSTYMPGKTANPCNLKHTPGGSSSGSAAAVADFMVPLAFGTQTEGSIIRPAAFCGVVGYKPSFGLICRAGVKPLVDSLDTVGFLARTVPDVALFAAALTDRTDLMVKDDVAPRRLAMCRTHEWDYASKETGEAFDLAAKTLSAAKVSVRDVDLPESFRKLNAAHVAVLRFEVARALAFERNARSEGFSPAFADLMKACAETNVDAYDDAMATVKTCRQELSQLFGEFDVILAPSAAGEAPEGLDFTGDRTLNRIWSALLVPCIHVPFFKGPRGLPVGLQVTGAFGSDARTLVYADWIHRRLS